MNKLLPFAGSFLMKNAKSLAAFLSLIIMLCVSSSSQAQIYYVMKSGGEPVTSANGQSNFTNGEAEKKASDAFFRIGYDGANETSLATSIGYSPQRIEIDGNNNRVFIADWFNTENNIKVFNQTTGAYIRTLSFGGSGASNQVRDLVYDPRTDYLYFITEGGDGAKHTQNDRVCRIKPDGTGSMEVVATADLLLNPYGLELDMKNNRLIIFQSNFAARKLFFVDIATNAVTSRSFATSYGTLWSIAYDDVSDYIYYTVADGSGSITDAKDMIRRQKSDGTGDELVADKICDNALELKLDLGNNRMFVNNGNFKDMKIVSLTLPSTLATVKSIYAGTFENTNGYPFLRDFAIARRAKIITSDVTLVSSTTTTFNGDLVFGYGLSTERGFVYSTTKTIPTLADTKVSVLTATTNGTFTKAITGLTPSTTYYVRAYSINGAGTMYGDVKTFTTTSNITNLTSLTLNAGTTNPALSPVFAVGTTSYTTSVTYDVASIKIKPAVEQASATVKVNNIVVATGTTTGDISLNTGTNIINTVVTAQDGVTTKTYTITVTRAKTPQTISITYPNAPYKKYGDADFDFGATASSTLPLTYTSSKPEVVTIVNNKIHIVGAGGTTITVSQAGNSIYLPATATKNIVIDKAVLVYTADTISRYYKQPNPTITGTLTGFVNGDTKETATYPEEGGPGDMKFICYFTETAEVGYYRNGDVGSYPVFGIGLASKNYSFTQSKLNDRIMKIKPLPIIYTVQPATKVYGTENPTFTVVYTNGLTGAVYHLDYLDYNPVQIVSQANKASDVGTYPVYVNIPSNLASESPMAAASNATALTITPATLKYLAQPATKIYGTANPALSGKLDGFLNNDTEANATTGTLTFSTTATAASAAGSYAINGSGKTAANYVIEQDAANNNTALTVTKNTLTYSATPISRAFNTTTNEAITGTITGFANGDTQASATTGTLAFTTAVTNTSGVGNYAVTGSGLSSTNYDIVQSGANASAYTIFLSSNGNLSSIGLSQGTLSPAFTSGVNSYKATVATEITSINITAVLSDANAHLQVNGAEISSGAISAAIPLVIGDNTIHVNVTAQDGTTTNPYTVVVKRLPSSDASFSAFNVSGVTATPNAANPNSFYGTAAKTVTSFNVTAAVHEPNATLIINGVETPSGSTVALPLNKGDNFYSVQIRAQDGVTYEGRGVFISRAFSDVKTLASLGISAGTLSPGFSPDTKNYTLAVSNATDTVTFTPTLTDTLSNINQDGLPAMPSFSKLANIGDNHFEIYVQAENGSQQVYNINIQREASHDASLASLGITTTTDSIETFNPTTYAYHTSVAYNVDALRLNPVATNSGATIKINGVLVNNNGGVDYFQYFTVPETTTIEVTAGDGTTTKTYTITATRNFSDNNLLANLQINEGAITLSPEFDPAIETYMAVISDPTVGNVLIKPTKGEDHQEIRVNFGGVLNGGSSQYVALNSGANNIGVRVLSQNFVEKNYTINIIRAFSANANLGFVTLSAGQGEGGGGSFSKNFNMAYDSSLVADVPNNVESIRIYPGPADEGASVTVNGYVVPKDETTDNLALALGDNTFTIGVLSADGTATKSYVLHVNRLPFADVTLSSLAINKGVINTPFLPDRTSYNVQVAGSDEYITVTPVANTPSAKVEVNNVLVNATTPTFTNPFPLSTFGATLLRVKVTAADGVNTKTYTLRVTRQQAYAATLGNITLSSGSISPVFSENTTNYTASVNNAHATVNLTPVTAAPNANITVTAGGNTTIINNSSPYAVIPLNVGGNVVTTTVKSLDETNTQTYTVTITRAQPAANAALAGLIFDGGSVSPAFSTGVNTYTSSVGYSISSTNITAAAADANAIVNVNGTTVANGTAANVPLVVGNNTFAVLVTAQDGSTTQSYNLVINRGVASTDATLAYLSSEELTISPAFVPGTLAYTASVTSAVNSVTLFPVNNNPFATVKINGVDADGVTGNATIPLTYGPNTITTLVTAEDGITTKTYTLTVNRAGSSNTFLSNISVSSSTALVATGQPNSFNTTIPAGTATITVTPTTADANATVKVNGITVLSGAASPPIAMSSSTIQVIMDVTAQDGVTVRHYTIAVTHAKSTNTRLSSIALTPSSALTKTGEDALTASVASVTTTVKVTPTAADAGAVIRVNNVVVASGSISSSVTLTGSSTPIDVMVTAEDGVTVRHYTITVNRTGSSNTLLSSISLTPSSVLTATGGANTFTTSVSPATATVNVTPTAADAGAVIRVNNIVVASGSMSSAVTLTGSSTPIDVMVTAEDGVTVRHYTITVNRTGSSNTFLSNLSVSASTALVPTGQPNAFNTTVAAGTATITVTPTTADANATVKVNGITVLSGAASPAIAMTSSPVQVSVDVTAQDGVTVRHYTIVVTHARSTNTRLSSIALTPSSVLTAGRDNAFTASVAPATTTVKVTPTAADAGAVIRVNNVVVASGSISSSVTLTGSSTPIDIMVTAEDGVTVRHYTITVNRTGSSNTLLSNISFSPSSALTATGGANAFQTTVAAGVTTIRIIPTAADASATIAVNGTGVLSGTPSSAITLTGNSTQISILVTAGNGVNTRTYSITVLKSTPAPIAKTPNADIQPVYAADIVVHQGVSPNGDGQNDYLRIDNIDQYGSTKLSVMNAAGALVYETQNYGQNGNVFDGHANKNGNALQKAGTYYYQLEYKAEGDITKRKSGYLVLKY